MAKVTGQSADLSGKVGSMTYAQTKYGTVVYANRRQAKVPRRSEKQMLIRMQWGNLAAVYRQFHATLKKAYEDATNMSVYNAFVQANMKMVEVYITKQMRLNGGSVLAPYQISRGTLDSIYFERNAANRLVTDISLGSLGIDAQTTVADFSRAVMGSNPDWLKGDQLTFFYGRQTIDPVTGVPRAKISGWKVRLDPTDQQKLWDVVDALGFSGLPLTADGLPGQYVLGMSAVISDGAAAWIHSREDETGQLRLSTQYMYVDSTVLASYQGDAAFEASADSYGGINTKAVYLQPDEKTNSLQLTAYGLQGEQSSGGSSSGSSSGTGSGSGSGTGGGGSETPTVAAPTISGSTPFEESTTVTMSGPAGATIHYTTDGSAPTSASTAYTEALTLTDTTTVKAVAVKDGVTSSVTSRTFTKGSGETETE